MFLQKRADRAFQVTASDDWVDIDPVEIHSPFTIKAGQVIRLTFSGCIAVNPTGVPVGKGALRFTIDDHVIGSVFIIGQATQQGMPFFCPTIEEAVECGSGLTQLPPGTYSSIGVEGHCGHRINSSLTGIEIYCYGPGASGEIPGGYSLSAHILAV